MPPANPSSIPNTTTGPISRKSPWLVGIFLVGVWVYLYLFYAMNDMRWISLYMLLVPDDLVFEWVGRDWSRFAILDRLPIVSAAGLIIGTAFLVGRIVLDVLRVDRVFNALETTVFAIGVGLNILSMFAVAVGLAGLLHQRWIFGVALLVVAIASARRARRWAEFQFVRSLWKSPATTSPNKDKSRPEQHVIKSRGTEPPDGIAWLAIAFSLPFVALILLGGMLPPTQFDAREYHMQVPKEWFLEGKISFLPHNVYGNMPLGAELHSILGMVLMPGNDAWWWGTLVGKLVIAFFAPLTAMAIFAAGRRFFSTTAGAIAAFVYISTPGIAHVSMTGLIDGASAFYMLLAVYAVMLRRDAASPPTSGSPFSNSNSQLSTGESKPAFVNTDGGLVAVSGFLSGAGVACKYPAVVFLVAPLLAYVALIQFRKIQWKSAVIYATAAAAGCGLWLGKNWVLAHNPTYPLLYSWFDHSVSWNAEKNARWQRAHGPPHDAAGRTHSLAQLWDSVRVVSVRSDLLGPALWPLAIWSLFVRRNRRWLWVIGGLMIWITAVWWLATHRLDRFLIPLLPLAALLAGVGAIWRNDKFWKGAVAGQLLFSLVANFVFSSTVAMADNRYFVSLSDLRHDLPRTEDHSDTRIHDAIRFLNGNVLPGYRALFVGEAQVYDVEVSFLYNTCFDDCIFESLMKGKPREERLQALRENRISHVYFSWKEINRYRQPGNYGYSDYPTPELVHREFVVEQRLFRPVPLELDPKMSEVYEVVGWEDWR